MAKKMEYANQPSRNGQAKQPLAANLKFGVQCSASVLAELQVKEPEDVYDLAESMRKDYQVQLADLVLRANLKAAKVEISALGADQKQLEDDRAKALVERLTKIWDLNLDSMAHAVGNGRTAYEIVWEYIADKQLNQPSVLVELPRKNTQMLVVDGKFAGIRIWANAKDYVDLDLCKSFWASIDATAIELHGKSRYTGAPYEVWKDREETKRLRKLFLKKFILSGGTAHVPSEVKDENNQSIDVFAKTAEAYDLRVAGGLFIFPNSRDREGNYEYEYTEGPSTLDPAPVDYVLDGMDVEQLRAFGIPEKTVMEGSAVGSFAMVSQQMLTLFSVVEDLLKQFANAFQEQIIDPCVAYNWYSEDPAKPTILITVHSLRHNSEGLILEIVKLLVATPQLSPIIASGAINLGELFKQAGIPVSPDLEQKISALLGKAPAPPPNPQAPGGLPGENGNTPPINPNAPPADATTDPLLSTMQQGLQPVAGQPAAFNGLLALTGLAERVSSGRLGLETAVSLAQTYTGVQETEARSILGTAAKERRASSLFTLSQEDGLDPFANP